MSYDTAVSSTSFLFFFFWRRGEGKNIYKKKNSNQKFFDSFISCMSFATKKCMPLLLLLLFFVGCFDKKSVILFFILSPPPAPHYYKMDKLLNGTVMFDFPQLIPWRTLYPPITAIIYIDLFIKGGSLFSFFLSSFWHTYICLLWSHAVFLAIACLLACCFHTSWFVFSINVQLVM